MVSLNTVAVRRLVSASGGVAIVCSRLHRLPAAPGLQRGATARAAVASARNGEQPTRAVGGGKYGSCFSTAARPALGAADEPRAVVDPGREEVVWEYCTLGEVLFEAPLDAGGSVQVTRHDATDFSPPPGADPRGKQEWRVLRFLPAQSSNNLLQSVTKVCVEPASDPADPPVARLRSEVLGLAYTKSLVAVCLSALAALGVSAEADVARPRILCIGLGGGSVPSFLTRALPRCEVDVVELEPAVIRAAKEAMGFGVGPRLRVWRGDGAAFALRAAADARAGTGGDVGYDAVLVDAYSPDGDVPGELTEARGGLARALASGLLRGGRGVVAGNFLPDADVGPVLEAYGAAVEVGGAERGPGYTVQARGSGNRIAVQVAGGLRCTSVKELRCALEMGAATAGRAAHAPFVVAALATRSLELWH